MAACCDRVPKPAALRNYIVLGEEVKKALAMKRPIVALESTVLSHGLPYPENLGLANSMEDIVRKGGCVPCTIALLDGKIHFGLEATQIERLALAGKKDGGKPKETIHKVSVRDLAWILSTGASGATTVAATCFLAAIIGVHVFATGGIGGVHRDGHITMDVSADLVEMSRSPVVVVCAGAKSILDIGRTLEYLETLGVPVIGYGTDEFPAFFTRKSDIRVPLRLDSSEAIAKLMHKSLELDVGRGVLVGVPIQPKDEADAIIVEKAIQQALKEAEEQKVTGRDITPFILGRVSKLTEGQSLKANIALLQQNAKVAAEIAFELNKIRNGGSTQSCSANTTPSSCPPACSHCPASSSPVAGGPTREVISWSYSKQGNEEPKYSYQRNVYRPVTCTKTGQFGCHCGTGSSPVPTHSMRSNVRAAKGPVLVFGGIAVDVLSKPGGSTSSSEENVAGLSIPGDVTLSAGGVGRNITEALTKFGVVTELVSALGSGAASNASRSDGKVDFFGQFLLQDCRDKGIRLIPVVVPNERTAVYNALSYSDGKFRGGVAHMSILESLSPSIVDKVRPRLEAAQLVIVDANLPAPTIAHVLKLCLARRKPVLFEPTSASKVVKLSMAKTLSKDNALLKAVTFLKPNLSELKALAAHLRPTGTPDPQDDIDACLKIVLESGIQHVILTLGAQGVKLVSLDKNADKPALSIQSFQPEATEIVDVNGAGDSLAAGVVFGHLSGLELKAAVKLGLRAAKLTIESSQSVSPKISASLLNEFAPPVAHL